MHSENIIVKTGNLMCQTLELLHCAKKINMVKFNKPRLLPTTQRMPKGQ